MSGTKINSMGTVADHALVLPRRRRCRLAPTLAVTAMLIGTAPPGHAAPGPPPQPPVPV